RMAISGYCRSVWATQSTRPSSAVGKRTRSWPGPLIVSRRRWQRQREDGAGHLARCNRQLSAAQRRQRPRQGEPDACGAVLAVGGERVEETRDVRDGEVGVGDAESDELAGRAG